MPLMSDDRVTTADQDAWVDLASRVRAKLGEMVNDIPAMKPEEASKFVEACNDAYWFGVRCAMYDKRVDLELARVTAD